MALINATDSNFESKIGNSIKLVDFWAAWCGPCKMIAPTLDEIAKEYEDYVDVIKVEVDENQETASKYEIMSVPTLMIFKDGEPVDKLTGFQPKTVLKEWLDRYITPVEGE